MSRNDPVMRARDPADPDRWYDDLIRIFGGAFVIWIVLLILSNFVWFIISGEWVP